MLYIISTIRVNYLLFNRYFFYRDWEREWRKYLAYERVTANVILKMHIKTLARLKNRRWKSGLTPLKGRVIKVRRVGKGEFYV